MTSLAFTIVQLAAALLTLLGQAPNLSAPARAQLASVADQAVATAVWTLKTVPATTPVDVDANIHKLRNALYISEAGGRIALGVKHPLTGGVMELLEEYASFGHLDADGLSDAMPIVRTTYPDGRTAYHLAIMRNFAGAFVNTLREPLPELETVYEHRIANEGLHLDFKAKGAERTTVFYIAHPQYKEAPPFVIVRNPEPLAVVDRTATMGNKLASFLIFAAPWSGGVSVRSVTLNKDFDHGIRLANLRVAHASRTQANVQDAESEMVFPVELSVPAGTIGTLDVYADVTGGETGTRTSVLDLISGEAMSGTGGSLAWPAPVDGQDIVVR